MTSSQKNDRALVALLAPTLVALVAVRSAWVSDEAYVTFRTIDNFVQGYGLRWNVAERVQAYTHPLWLGMVGVPYLITREPYFTALALSIALTAAAAYVLVTRIATDTAAAVGAVAVLVLSKAFVDFSTSGLETPLTFFLLTTFFALYFNPSPSGPRLQRLILTASLLTLTDATAAWLVAPAIATRAWQEGWPRARRMFVVGLLPLVAWEIFAIAYYGSPLPNATYARLFADVPPARLARIGFVYLLDSVNLDPITFGAIVAAACLGLIELAGGASVLAIGMAVYLVAIVRMGGDPMSGRLLAAPLLCAAMGIGRLKAAAWPVALRAQLMAVVAAVGLMAVRPALSNASAGSPRLVSATSGIGDERLVAYPRTGLLNTRRRSLWPEEAGVPGGRRARSTEPVVLVLPTGGMAGFYAGPLAHVLTTTGVGDPLLARLPAARPWSIGTPRDLPPGYVETLASGTPRLGDAATATLYKRVALLTRAPIWSWQRWRAIVGLTS